MTPEPSIEAIPLDAPHRRRWTRAEVEQLESLGIFEPGRHELLEGELFDTMGKLPPHTFAMLSMLQFLRSVFGESYLSHKAAIDLAPEDNPTNQPEPDIIVLTQPFGDFANRYPLPADIRLLVEVADASLSVDLRIKRDLYARAGIVEYWVLDLNARRLIVHRHPNLGQYVERLVIGETEPIAPLAAPENPLRVQSVLPPMAEAV